MTLEAFQSGLSWITILRKRDNFRRAFAGFDPERVAEFGPDDVDRLMADAGIVRNRAKIEAAINNAQVVAELGPRVRRRDLELPGHRSAAARRADDWRATSPESVAMADS